MPSYNGTLAAVRCLGEQGVPVIVAMETVTAAGAWSRHVQERVSCPGLESGPERILDWLEQRGPVWSGAVLYPTSDEYAWTLAFGVERLSKHYRMYSPSVAVLGALLDKSSLARLCSQVGIATPKTYLPTTAQEASDCVAQHGRLLLKPRSQAYYSGPGKGQVVSSPGQARSVFTQFTCGSAPTMMTDACPGIMYPMLQEFVSTDGTGTYSISGFIDRTGTILTHVACVKTVQSPPSVGVGLEFEVAPVRADLLAAIERLCRHAGYFGVFEVEFVMRDGEPLLVDFNPRYFGQMAFDVARGSLLPWLVHLCATGHEEDARRLAQEAPPSAEPASYVHRVGLGFTLLRSFARPTLRRAVSATLARANLRRSVDATWSRHDPLPAVAAAAALGRWALRHPLTMMRLISGTSS